MTEEKSTFLEVFGGSPLIKVLDFFLTFRDFDYPLTEIAENSNVAWSTLNQIFPHLTKNKIVKETRQIGRARLFMLNKDNPIVQQLIEMDNKIMKYFSDLDTKEELLVQVKRK